MASADVEDVGESSYNEESSIINGGSGGSGIVIIRVKMNSKTDLKIYGDLHIYGKLISDETGTLGDNTGGGTSGGVGGDVIDKFTNKWKLMTYIKINTDLQESPSDINTNTDNYHIRNEILYNDHYELKYVNYVSIIDFNPYNKNNFIDGANNVETDKYNPNNQYKIFVFMYSTQFYFNTRVTRDLKISVILASDEASNFKNDFLEVLYVNSKFIAKRFHDKDGTNEDSETVEYTFERGLNLVEYFIYEKINSTT